MKTRFTQKFLMAFLMIGLFTTSQAQTYVNGSASGANDGSSWADAYTDLGAALGAATSGDVWVAAGTYSPTETFEITSPINVYGGFAGTEASLTDRVDGNTTILSGDIAGDDMDNIFTANKADNIAHVMSIDVGATDIVILDGLTISGGVADVVVDPNDTYPHSGAGVYTTSTVEVNNCHFHNNTCANGAGIFMIGNSDNSKINNCIFEKSLVSERAAGAMTNTLNDISVTNSTFRDNVTGRGALYLVRGSNGLVDNCTFTNNMNLGGFGAGIMIWNGVDGRIQNSTFTGNTAGNAAGIYIDGRELAAGQNHFTLDNVTFTDNVVSGSQGGGIQTFNSSHTMSNCTFTNNSAPSFGGGHIDNGENQVVISNNNTFKNNSSSSVGGGHAFNGGNTVYMVTGNTYDSNSSSDWGGAIFSGFGARSIFTNCLFEENESINGPAGAIWAQNDTTTLTIERSQFVGNSSGGAAGAVGLFGAIPLNINNSFFSGNSAVGFGGAINGSEQSADEPGEAKVTISNSIFRENFTDAQGAGFSLVDYDVDIINTEFSTNINQGEGAGGAISLNATDTSTVEVNIMHSTIVSNFGIIGAGIASFTGETDSKLSITLTNTILANVDGNNYEVEGGTPKFSSNGGNISSDDSAAGGFTNTNDVNGADADELFEDIDDFDYQLTGTSIAKDNGVDAGVPQDINGNDRVDAPDSGAYECVDPLSTTVLENNGQLTMTPNPAATVSTITVDNAWNGIVNIIVTDMTGKVVSNQNMNKSAQTQDFNLNVSELSEGNYILTLRAEDAIVSTQFIKI